MSTRPLHLHSARARFALDPSVGGATSRDPTEDPLASFLTDRAIYVPLSEWAHLGRDERIFAATILTYLYQGKGALLHSLARARAKTGPETPEGIPELLGRGARHQSGHVAALETLLLRLEDSQAGLPETRDLVPVIRFFESVSGTFGEADAAPLPASSDAVPLTVAFAQIAVGVVSQTGFRVLTEFLHRNAVLEECANLLAEFRRSDATLSRRISRVRGDLRDRAPELEAYIADHIDASVVACVSTVREVQDRFDFLSKGLVPEEFVAYTFDRYFELGTDDAPPLS